MSQVIYNLIGSTARPVTVDTFAVTHPGTGTVVHEAQRSTKDDIESAIATAEAGFKSWSATPLAQRCEVIKRAAELLADKSSGWHDKIAQANKAETSVPTPWAAWQLENAPQFMHSLAELAPVAFKTEEVSGGHGAKHLINYAPYGVCLAIVPWNAAVLLTSRAVITPLLSGNSVILKTSEAVPYTHSQFAELLFAAGLPRDALCVVHVAPQDAPVINEALIADRRVRHVNFTGSTRVGSIIGSLAGRHLKPSLLELGGKAPTLVLPDADVEVAASHILFGAFLNTGQICMSTERLIVPHSLYPAVADALRAAWAHVKTGPKALYSNASGERLRGLVTDAESKGAEDVLGAGNPNADELKDAHVTHRVFAVHKVPSPAKTGSADIRLLTEESFGPLLAVLTVDDEGRSEADVIDHMVAIANDSDYGLSASVWGKDVKRATEVAQRIESGAVHINSPTVADDPAVPHGGVKFSGYGRFNGIPGLREFTQFKSIEVVENPQPLPLAVFEL